MREKYSIKIQVIRSKKQRPRLYVYMPAALVEAISIKPGEEVQWEMLDRSELHLVRKHVTPPRAKHRVASLKK